MAREAGTLERIASEFADALGTLGSLLSAANIAAMFDGRLGIVLPPSVTSNGGFVATLASVAASASGLAALNLDLTVAMKGDDSKQIATSGLQVLAKLAEVFNRLGTLAPALNGAIAAAPTLDAAERAALNTFAATLPRKLFDFAFVEYLRTKASGVVPTLSLLGLVDDPIPTPSAIETPFLLHLKPGIHFDRLRDVFFAPQKFLLESFGFGGPAFDGLGLFARLQQFFDAARMPSAFIQAPGMPPILDAFAFRFAPDNTVAPPRLSVRVRLPATQDVASTHKLGDVWSLTQAARARFDEGLEVTIAPPLDFSFKPATGTVNVDYQIGLEAAGAADKPIVLFGATSGSRIEAERFTLTLGIRANWDAGSATARGAPFISLTADKGKAVISTPDDSFLRFLTGGIRGETSFSLSGSWSPGDGLRFDGGSGLEIAIPTHGAIGTMRLNTFYLRAGVDADGSIPVEVSAAIGAELGPLDVQIDRVGIIARFKFPASGGNLGPLDLSFEPKWPSGLGLAIDAGGFKGGGFLYFDRPKGEYAGAFDLEFQSLVTVKAIGILDTKVPDIPGGFSLLILITAEFIPIQLGFGFTLVGVGGLLGLNRTVFYDALRAGVYDGSLNSVLFPRDVVANAPRIIGDLKRIFPPCEGRFLIGPMAKLGWGTPTLMSLELGILLEIPRPAFAVLGVLRVSIPAEEAPLLRLQVNFLGALDFETQQLSFDASIVDSYLLTFTLTGDMALRLYWGSDANFLLSVGGFHPAYTPPPLGLPPLRRLAIEMFAGFPQIRAEAYFAITSNTAQFGARVELMYGVDLFNVYGFMSLDVLIQFNPVHFIAQMSAMLAVRTGSTTLMGVQVDATLEGPAAWHARGTGTFRIGFIIKIKLSASFDVSFGDERRATLPPIPVLPLLHKELENKGNWRAILPPNAGTSVSLRELAATDADNLILHPFSILEISQKLVPLDLPIDRFGTQKPSDGPRYRIVRLTFGAEVVTGEATIEQFAPAQFLEMNDAQKLSRRSFEQYNAGLRVGGGDRARADYCCDLEVAYEVHYLPIRRRGGLFRLSALLMSMLARGSAVAKSSLSQETRAPSPLAAQKITMSREQYGIASSDDLTLHGEDMVFGSQAEAHAAMTAEFARNPELVRRLQVVPMYEVAAT